MALPTQIQYTLLATFTALLLASFLSALARWRNPGREMREIRSRVRTWWVIVVLFAITLLVSPVLTVCFFALVSFLALKEFLSMTPTRRADRRVLFYAYLAIPIQYFLASSQWYALFITFIPVFMLLALPTRMLLIGETRGFLPAVSTLQWGLMLTVFCLSHAAFLMQLTPGTSPRLDPAYDPSVPRGSTGIALLLFLLLLTEVNDIAQWCWSKVFGQRQVAPSVSRGKTYAGLLGGAVTIIAAAMLLGPWLTLMDPLRSALAGLIIAVGGFLGDLCLSAVKRDLGIKDFGATLPGHGGVLDRVDSLLFTAPLFFHYVHYLYG